jgi:hypothetical protein
LQAVLRNLEPGLLDGLEAGQIAAIIGQVTYALQEALDLIREPERAPGWRYKDPAILQERGRGSRAVARNFANLAKERPAGVTINKVLTSPHLQPGRGVAGRHYSKCPSPYPCPTRTFSETALTSGGRGKADSLCSERVLPSVTHRRHWLLPRFGARSAVPRWATGGSRNDLSFLPMLHSGSSPASYRCLAGRRV